MLRVAGSLQTGAAGSRSRKRPVPSAASKIHSRPTQPRTGASTSIRSVARSWRRPGEIAIILRTGGSQTDITIATGAVSGDITQQAAACISIWVSSGFARRTQFQRHDQRRRGRQHAHANRRHRHRRSHHQCHRHRWNPPPGQQFGQHQRVHGAAQSGRYRRRIAVRTPGRARPRSEPATSRAAPCPSVAAARTAVSSLTATSPVAFPPALLVVALPWSTSPAGETTRRPSTAPFPAPSTPPLLASRSNIVATGLAAVLGSTSSDGSAALNANGPITVTGIAQPGASANVTGASFSSSRVVPVDFNLHGAVSATSISDTASNVAGISAAQSGLSTLRLTADGAVTATANAAGSTAIGIRGAAAQASLGAKPEHVHRPCQWRRDRHIRRRGNRHLRDPRQRHFCYPDWQGREAPISSARGP